MLAFAVLISHFHWPRTNSTMTKLTSNRCYICCHQQHFAGHAPLNACNLSCCAATTDLNTQLYNQCKDQRFTDYTQRYAATVGKSEIFWEKTKQAVNNFLASSFRCFSCCSTADGSYCLRGHAHYSVMMLTAMCEATNDNLIVTSTLTRRFIQ